MFLRWLRRILIWAGPVLVLFLAVACGFLYWTIRSPSGTRWALTTAMAQLGGQVEGVSGSLWQGVDIQSLKLDMADFSLRLSGARLQVAWPELVDRRLHVVDLSANAVDLDLRTPAHPAPDTGPFSMPAVPVDLMLDRLAVGSFSLSQDGKPVPVAVSGLDAALSLSVGASQPASGRAAAQLLLRQVVVAGQGMRAQAQGQVNLLDLRQPWPLDGHLALSLEGQGSDSPLCVRRYVPALPSGKAGPAQSEPCSAQVDVTAKGSTEQLDVTMSGRGQSLGLDAQASLTPTGSFPLRSATVALNLADGSSLDGRFDWATALVEGIEHDQVTGSLRTRALNVGALAGSALPPAVVTMSADFEANLLDHQRLQDVALDMDVAKGSSWNRQPLAGHLKTKIVSRQPAAAGGPPAPGGAVASPAREADSARPPVVAAESASATASAPARAVGASPATPDGAPASPAAQPWLDWAIQAMDVDLQLGADRVKAKGALGDPKSRLDLDVRAPNLAAFWPDLPGGLNLAGRLEGGVARHQADLTLTYAPGRGGKAAPRRGGAARTAAGSRKAASAGKAVKAGRAAKTEKAQRAAKTEKVAGAAREVELGTSARSSPSPGKTSAPDVLAMPVRAAVRLAGQWGPERAGAPDGWRGTLSALSVEVGDLGARLQAPVTASFMPSASGDTPQWQVGTVDIQVLLPMKKSFVLRNQLARGGQGWWETRGGIDKLALSPRLIQALHQRFAPAEPENDNGGVRQPGAQQKLDQELVLAADWNLKFKGALTGQAHLRRVSGDLFVPGDPGFLLGLRTLDLGVTARPRGGAASQIAATLDVATEKKGRISAQATAVLHTAGKAAWTLDTGVPQSVKVNADIADLAWLDVFLGDQTELGGSLRADISASSGARGAWQTSGTLRGQDIKFLRIDDGVRLFNGTLAAHLDGSKVILDSLKFPSVLRVAPKEWRTAEWVKTSPDAKGGSLTVTGEWDLFDSTGKISAKLYRYPILQRSDRYAMLTGGVTVDARLPSISVTGDVKADAGWFDLDVLGSVPTVDSDVVVIRPGQQQVARVPSDISLDLKIDLGSRFYLTGYGVNSGLVGSLHVLLNDNKLTGVGELRTRGGSIDVYGQHLQLRRGTVTFQGNIANPVLSIEALRTDVAVRAGVRVTGTAKKPKIDLVSYPDVSEVEKLSWLLLGRAPDEGGGDVALLFTVGSSLVGGGEPFYRKLGLDELSIRTGELGSTGSVLPPDSVVSSANQGPSQLEQQFAQAGKHLSDGVTLSLEQALASTGTVGRLSYKLSRRLRAQLSVGTVNGVALVYHVFFDD